LRATERDVHCRDVALVRALHLLWPEREAAAHECPLCARTGPSVRVRFWSQLRHAMLLEEIERMGAKMCLLGRWADVREVAYPILWLASDEASYVTGSGLMVDGGQFTK
jgi:NAD(P)-dependent dehydrogenase (short-subunit alcohol dehydrogenase family)